MNLPHGMEQKEVEVDIANDQTLASCPFLPAAIKAGQGMDHTFFA